MTWSWLMFATNDKGCRQGAHSPVTALGMSGTAHGTETLIQCANAMVGSELCNQTQTTTMLMKHLKFEFVSVHLLRAANHTCQPP